MERVVAPGSEIAIDRDQVLDRGDLAGQDDAIAPEAKLPGAGGTAERGGHQRFARHLLGPLRLGQLGVGVHHPGQQIVIEAAPVDADSYGLGVFERLFDHDGELPVPFVAKSDVSRIDAVLVQRLGAVRIVAQQLVPVVMEVAHQRHLASQLLEPLADGGDGHRRFLGVHRDADDLRTGGGERRHLGGGGLGVGGVGIGHGLDHDRRTAADGHVADGDADTFAPWQAQS